MRFDPGDDRLICDHCGATEPIDHGPWTRANAIKELDFQTALAHSIGSPEEEVTRTSSCPNCGAQIEFDPVVADTGANRQIKPRAVLPFALEEGAARQAMIDWLGNLWFAPNGLTEYARKGRRLSGVYTPCWTFDADTKSAYRGQRGTVYETTRSVRRGGKTERITTQEVRWRPVSGRVSRFFDDVVVIASTALPPKFRPGVTHWDLTALEPYQPQYLAGFRAEAYTVDLEAAYVEAREIMDRQILRDIRFDIGGDRQRVDHVDTVVSDVTFKHILVPVWLAAYKYRGRSFRFVVNGQTGQVAGERPWSAWKLFFAFLAAGIVAGVFGYFYAMNQ